MKINREELLQKLESVSPGLAQKEITEQSSCYAFQDGKIKTYNDEIYCEIESPVDITAVVPSKPLTDLLQKLVEDELDISVEESELKVKAKRRKAGIKVDMEVLLPFKEIEKPEEWKPLHEDFCEAVGIVHHCAANDESNFSLTCVHITPVWVEACDNLQIIRYPLETGMKREFLIRKESIKHITGLGMTEFSETENWIHFRNPSGLVLSSKRWMEDYEELDSLFKVEGSSITLPGGLSEAVGRAEIFSAETIEDNSITVTLKKGKLRLKGEGASGWYEETKNIKYNGPSISFTMSPKLLVDITKRTKECVVSQDKLKIDAGKFCYVACLGSTEDD